MKSVKLAVAGAGLLALASCAGSPQPSANQKETKATEVAPATEEAPQVASLPKISEQEASEPEFDVPEVSILKGRAPDEIRAIFGTPVLKRQDSPTEMWQYLTQSCALHLVFYPTEGTEALTVQYISMNSRTAVKAVPAESCFESQLRRLGAEKVKELTG